MRRAYSCECADINPFAIARQCLGQLSCQFLSRSRVAQRDAGVFPSGRSSTCRGFRPVTTNSDIKPWPLGQSHQSHAETIKFEFVGGGDGAMTREDILLHLVNHATYHRGFVTTLLFPLKPNGAASDLTVFLRDAWPDMSQKTRETIARANPKTLNGPLLRCSI